jgi:hypothetical protein
VKCPGIHRSLWSRLAEGVIESDVDNEPRPQEAVTADSLHRLASKLGMILRLIVTDEGRLEGGLEPAQGFSLARRGAALKHRAD